MAKRYMVSPVLFTISAVVCGFCLIMAGILLWLARPGSAAVFGVIALIYGIMTASYGSMVTVGPRGIHRRLFGITTWEKTWEEIGEVGICGTRVFKDPKSKNVGTLYLYFSPEAMDEKQRFDMILKWPPKEKCFLLYNFERMRTVQMLWDSKIETYNAGDHSFGEGLKN